MKRFFLMLGLAFPTALLAQIEPATDDKQTDLLGKGTIGVSLNATGGYASYASFMGATYRLTPRLSYFLKDGWSVSLEGRYEKYAELNRYTGVGVSTRYYFVRNPRLALFLQAGVTAGQSKFTSQFRDAWEIYRGTGSVTTRAIQTNVGLGMQYRLSSRWAIEGSMEGTSIKREAFNTPLYRLQGNVGVSFRLNK